MRAVLCLVVLCAALYSSAYAAPTVCEFTEGEFYPYTDVLNCFHSILLTDDVKFPTLATLRRSIEVYAFFDIANHSPDPNLVVNVDMRTALQQIWDRTYFYDKDFHDDLRDLYIQLNDAHTQYYAPTCYQNILPRQGFAPVGWGDSEDNFQIRISPFFPDDLVQYYNSQYNINLPDYTNYTINTINGVPAYQYFMTYANYSVGMSKDAGTRLNFALTVPEPRNDISVIQYGYWQQRTKRNPFPETSSVVYGLTSTSGEKVTVSLPWSFKALKTYTGYESWLADYNSPWVKSKPDHGSLLRAADEWIEDQFEGDLTTPDTASFMPLSHESEHATRQEEYKRNLLREHFGADADSMTFELLVNSTHLTFWALSDGKTLVMYLDTMEPGRGSGFLPDLEKGFKIAAERGLTQFIIDLTNNGGGNICLGRALLAMLQKEGWKGEGQNWGPQDLPLSPFAEQMIHTAVDQQISNTVWSPDFYNNQQNQPISLNDTSYLLPGVPHERGGFVRNYSRLVHIDGCDWGYLVDLDVNFSPEKTVMITKGLCGSTCALFANHMALYDDVRTVVLGGMPGRSPMQYTSFPGLQVLDNGPLFGQFFRLKQNISYVPYADMDMNDIVPRLLPTTASFRYCIREIYPPEADYDTKPTEYTFQPADYHYWNNELTANYPQYVWYDVLDLFN